MIKYPLAGVSALFAAGILLGRFVPGTLPWLFAATLTAGLAALSRTRRADVFATLFIVLSGWTHFAAAVAPLHPADLRHRSSEPRLVTVLGRLETTPEYRIHERLAVWHTNTLAILECHALRESAEGPWLPAHGHLLISTPGPVPEVFGRDATVRLTGVLSEPRGPEAPGTFDYASHLRWRGIHRELRVAGPVDWAWASGSATHIAVWDERFQRWARESLARGLPETDAALRLLWAMTLGWKTGITDDVEEPFMRSGTMHLFAISGLHIALIAGLITQVLQMLRVPRLGIAALVLPLVWLYTAATGWQPSAIRATLMTTAVVGGWILIRPAVLLNSLAAAALAVLIWDPCQLFQAGFQLSFSVVAAIALLQPPLHRGLCRLTAPDPLIPEVLVSRSRKIVHAAWTRLASALAVSLAAWAGSIPLCAAHFHLLTPSSLVANLIVVPLSSAALASNLGALACVGWAPGITEVLNHGAWFWMRSMMIISEGTARLPGGCWNVQSWPLGWVALWYMAILCAGFRRRPGPLACRMGAGIASLCILAGWMEWDSRQADLRITVLPLRGGHAVCLDHAGRFDVVDTGDDSAARHVTLPFLRAQGADRLEILALTHGDIRHVGGAPRVADAFPPHAILRSPIPFRSKIYREAVRELESRHRKAPRVLSAPTNLPPFRVLHPFAADSFPRADDGSLVLEIAAGTQRVLLAGDLGTEGQQRLLRRHPDLRADVVIAGLSDRGACFTPSVIDQLGTQLLIVADAELPATARAREELKRSLRSTRSRVWFTSELGSVTLEWRGSQLTASDRRGTPLALGGNTPRPGAQGRSVPNEAGIVSSDEIQDGHADR